MRYDTKRQAVEAWVDSFNEIPLWLIENDMYEHPENWVVQDWVDPEDFGEEGEPYLSDCAALPMWGWVWSFSDSADDSILERHREEVIDLGFTIIENIEHGEVWLGIDGAGYDFISEHFIPLYDLFGLQWHREAA